MNDTPNKGHLCIEETFQCTNVVRGSTVHTCACALSASHPRHACAARVTVLGLSFRLSVCPSVRLSVTTLSPATRDKTAKKRYQRVQCHTGFILKWRFW